MRKKDADFLRSKQEMEVCDKDALYFLMVLLIMIVTFSLFKGEIVRLLFANL